MTKLGSINECLLSHTGRTGINPCDKKKQGEDGNKGNRREIGKEEQYIFGAWKRNMIYLIHVS